LRRELLQGHSHALEERIESLDAAVAIQAGQHLRHDPPVLHRVARARRCLRSIGEDAPVAIDVARQVGGGQK
jgi:hypothetical protein